MLENYFNIKKKRRKRKFIQWFKHKQNITRNKREQQGKYPVISLNLKGVKDDNWEKELDMLKTLISRLYLENKEVIEVLEDIEIEYYNNIIRKTASEGDYQLSLKSLSMFLTKIINNQQ